MLDFVSEQSGNIVDKVENVGYQHFSPVSTMIPKLPFLWCQSNPGVFAKGSSFYQEKTNPFTFTKLKTMEF